MRKKYLILTVALVAALCLLGGTFFGGYLAGRYTAIKPELPSLSGINLGKTPIPPNASIEPFDESWPTSEDVQETTPHTPAEISRLFSPFWEAWDIVHDQYIDQPVDDEKLMQGAIRGMLDALGDEHTSYMDPDEYLQANIPMNGEYEGIGAWVDTNAEYLTIVSPMPDSPAEKAGLRPGDQVIAIDGEDMTGIDGNLVIRKVLGPAGSKVTLTIRREGVEEPLTFEIIRARIIVPSLRSEMLENNIAYIELLTFGEDTTTELHKTLQELLAQKPIGLILDLRYNGGGYLQTAIEVASEFIAEGVIMYEEFGNGYRETYKATGNGIATEIPLVVLVNEGSASASEIVAGAIQDYGRGTLVGVKTFGKGSVQNWIELSNNQGAVRVTIARWLTPNGRTIHKTGLEPDVIVEMTEEDYDAKKDPQLDMAIQILLEKMSK